MLKTTLLAAALGGAFLLAPLSATAGAQAGAQAQAGTTLADAGLIGGQARGPLNLPGPAGPGKLHALLRGPLGVPLFEVEAQLLPQPGGLPGPGGTVDGVVRALVGPSAGQPIAALKGVWAAKPGGKGKLAAAMLVPGADGPQKVGLLRGKFLDAKPGPLPGQFDGIWRLKKPAAGGV